MKAKFKDFIVVFSGNNPHNSHLALSTIASGVSKMIGRETNWQLLLTAKCSLILHHPVSLFRHDPIIIMSPYLRYWPKSSWHFFLIRYNKNKIKDMKNATEIFTMSWYIAMRKQMTERSKNQKSFPMHSDSKDCNFASKDYISTYSS